MELAFACSTEELGFCWDWALTLPCWPQGCEASFREPSLESSFNPSHFAKQGNGFEIEHTSGQPWELVFISHQRVQFGKAHNDCELPCEVRVLSELTLVLGPRLRSQERADASPLQEVEEPVCRGCITDSSPSGT